jgi:hypothetical protein
MSTQYFKNSPLRIIRNEPKEVQDWFMSLYNDNKAKTNDPAQAYDYAAARFNSWKDDQNKITGSIGVQIQECADESIVPSDVLAEIKKTDQHPFLAVFGVGKEGVSYGGGIKKIWSFSAIKNLAKTIVTKVKESAVDIIGDFHKSSDNEQRKSLGKVIHSFAKKINDELQAFSVMHITDSDTIQKIKSGYYDACSVDITANLNRQGQVPFVDQIFDCDNITILNSKINPPGFGNAASLITTIQESINSNTIGENNMENESKGYSSASELDDVQIKVAKNGWSIPQVFGDEKTKKDLYYQQMVKEEAAKMSQEAIKENDAKWESKLKRSEEKLAEANEKNSKYLVKDNAEKLSEVLKTIPELANKSDDEIKQIKYFLSLKNIDVLDTEQPQEIVSKAVSEVISKMTELGFNKQDDNVLAKTSVKSSDSGQTENKLSDSQSILAAADISL